MPDTELVLYNAFRAMLDGLEELKSVEFEILSENRAKYAGMLFDFDKIVGYAKDLRLIEYRIEDEYAGRKSRKVVHIYRYGTHPAGTEGIIRREERDPDGNWGRYFAYRLPGDILRDRSSGDWGQGDHQGGSGDHLPSGKPERKLLD